VAGWIRRSKYVLGPSEEIFEGISNGKNEIGERKGVGLARDAKIRHILGCERVVRFDHYWL
jgi:hypothetical protein